MERSFGVADVVEERPDWRVLVRRGLRRRCPRCGGGDVFVDRWRLRERCPGCGYRFRREPGFFLGAWFINFMILEVVHFVGVMAFIVWRSSHPAAPLGPELVGGALVAIGLPILCYPWSQTVWAAIDLAMTPLELHEIVEAADAVAGVEPGA